MVELPDLKMLHNAILMPLNLTVLLISMIVIILLILLHLKPVEQTPFEQPVTSITLMFRSMCDPRLKPLPCSNVATGLNQSCLH